MSTTRRASAKSGSWCSWLVLLLLLLAFQAQACRCKVPSNDKAYALASGVVLAQVADVVPNPTNEGGTAILDVIRSYKTTLPERIAVVTATNCAFPFEKNTRYVVFLNADKNGTLSTTKCTGTAAADDGDPLVKWLETKPVK